MSHFIAQPDIPMQSTVEPRSLTPPVQIENVCDPTGTTLLSRTVAMEFYLRNKKFVRSLKKLSSLKYFYKIWAKSLGTEDLDIPSPVEARRILHVNDIMHALKVDGGVLYWNRKGRLFWSKYSFDEPSRKPFSTPKIKMAEPEHDDGTEGISREWAKRFFVANSAFLCGEIRTRRALAYFWKVWSQSSYASIYDQLLPERPFNQVLYALVNHGKVCRVSRSRTGHIPLVLWTKHHRHRLDHVAGNIQKDLVSREELNRAVDFAIKETLACRFVPSKYTDADESSPEKLMGSGPPHLKRMDSDGAETNFSDDGRVAPIVPGLGLCS